MIDNVILESIETFCKEHVASQIELQVPNDENISEYQLMHPNVFIGWLPPPNQLQDVPQLPNGLKSAIPALVIGMDEGDDDGVDAGLNIRISFIVYNPGFYSMDGEFQANNKGYRDLLNLIFRCRQELAKAYILTDGKTAAQKPYRWGMYPDQPAGYYIGYLTFRASAASLPYLHQTDLIPE